MRSTPILLTLPLLLLAGCATYTESTNSLADSRRSGRVDLAARQAAQMARDHERGRDAIVYDLEAGSAERALALANLPPPPSPPPPSVPGVGATGAGGGPPPAANPSPSDGAYQNAIQFLSTADEHIDDYESKAKHSVST